METEQGALPEAEEAAAGGGARSLRLAAARSRRRSRLLATGLAVAVVLLVVVSAVAVSQWRRADRLARQEAQRRAIASAAASFGEALLSYDFEDLEAARRRVVRLATEGFGRNYSDAFSAGLNEAITQLQASAKATVRDVYVSGVTGDEAHAIVVLDSEVRSTAGTRQVVGSYLDLSMLRRGGKWKIDAVTSIAATRESNTPPGPPGPTTPPTAPASEPPANP